MLNVYSALKPFKPRLSYLLFRWKSGSGSLSGISLTKGRLWDNWLVQKSWRSSPTCQAFIGLGFFCGLGFLYGLGSWFASSQNTSLSDIKTTQEGFLEVSKILGDPRTTTHPATFEVEWFIVLLNEQFWDNRHLFRRVATDSTKINRPGITYVCTDRISDSRLSMYNKIFLKKLF